MSIMKVYSCAFAVMLLFSNITAFTQKSFSLKTIRPYVMPIYSINKSGMKSDAIFDNYDSNTVRQYRRASNDKVSTIPAKVLVKNNFNFAAGVDYEFWLSKKLFMGIGTEFRTLNNTVSYDLNFDKFLGSNSSFIPPDNEFYSYTQRLNLLSFSLHLGRSFKVNNYDFELRAGASIPFNLGQVKNFVAYNHYVTVSKDGRSYLLPTTYQHVNNFNRNSSFTPEGLRWHLYLGSNKSVNLFSKKPILISYGLQLNYVRRDDRTLRFYTFYDYSIDGNKVYYKNQLTRFSYSGVPELALKIGLAL